ncbi:hypothetical protein H8K55_06345 [Undibacterium sp. LX15W]|uniref:AlgX/AlgJ SGNH hydrolase-like domain-containing protein n=2 Tax=Undibacterium flavidum TaxID=2762297 RepID=A0ABR6YAH7_9BURK|nr:hypothetical protein [Undibacterium flavidum]
MRFLSILFEPIRMVRRHGFLCFWFVILLLPAVIQVLKLDQADPALENRELAALPQRPNNLAAVLAWTNQMDAYLNDHFGLRQSMIAWNNQLRFYGLGETASLQLAMGGEQTLFFTSHDAAHPQRMRQFLCGKGVTPAVVQELATSVTSFMQVVTQTSKTESKEADEKQATAIAFVPTKPILYSELLPAWMQAECAHQIPTLPAILQQIALTSPEVSNTVFYPLAAMQKQKAEMQLYPAVNFHWHGRGAQVFARELAEQQWHMDAARSLRFHPETVSSDLQRFMPGVPLVAQIESPDYGASNITACVGPDCFPELPSAAKLGDVSRYRWQSPTPTSGKKLLIISDSFGNGGAGYFSPYFSEVWHISINSSGQLSEQEMTTLRANFANFAPQQVLYLFHDYSISCFSRSLNYCPIELNKVLRQLHPFPLEN